MFFVLIGLKMIGKDNYNHFNNASQGAIYLTNVMLLRGLFISVYLSTLIA